MKSLINSRLTKRPGFAWVICHRWFRAGEDWAWSGGMSPALCQHILQQLQQEIYTLREIGQRQYDVRGGVLLVRTSADPNCPDPLARSRSPVLITAVYVPGFRIKNIQVPEIVSMLTEAECACRMADMPGGDPNLKVGLPERLDRAIRKRRIMKFSILTLALAATGSLVFAQSYPYQIPKKILDPDADGKDIKGWADAAEKQMRKWKWDDPDDPKPASALGNTRSKIVNEFLKRLSVSKSSSARQCKHIDGEYISRLPDSAEEVNSNPEEILVRKLMLGLLGKLEAKQVPEMETRKPEEIISEIAGTMDFRKWYTSVARKTCFNGRDDPLPEDERNYVYRFCPPATGLDDGGICGSLYDVMINQWGVHGLCKDDLRKRPWFVAGCFFEFLSLAALEGVPSTAGQSESPMMAAVRKNLPKGCLISKDRLRGDNLDRLVKDTLRELAKKLEVPTSGRDDRTILGAIQARLKDMADSALEGSAINSKSDPIVWYLERLACRGQTSPPARGGSEK